MHIYINIYIYTYIYIKHPSININHSGCRAWNRSPPPALPRCHALPRPQGMPLLDAVLEKKVRLGSNDELLGYTWIHHIFIVDINIYLPIWAYCNIMVYHKLLIKNWSYYIPLSSDRKKNMRYFCSSQYQSFKSVVTSHYCSHQLLILYFRHCKRIPNDDGMAINHTKFWPWHIWISN
jgi:hypothetical protein